MSDDQYGASDPGQIPPPPPPGGQAPPPPPATSAPPPPPPPPTAPVTPQAYAPPAGPSPAATATAAPPPPPAKSKKTLWIVLGIVAALLLCCCSVFGGIAFFAAQDAAKTQEALKNADTHYQAAEAALTGPAEQIAGLGAASSSGEVQRIRDETEAGLDEVDKELAAAKASVGTLSETSEVRTNYEAGIAEALKATALLRQMLDTLGGASEFNDTLKSGVDLNKKGKAKLEAATKANNKRKHSSAGGYAKDAESYFRKSKAKFKAADEMDPNAKVSVLYRYVDLQINLAKFNRDLARYGKSGGISNYNRTVKRYNSARAKFNALPEPDLLTGDYYQKILSQLQEQLMTASEKADELIAKARAAAGGSSSTP